MRPRTTAAKLVLLSRIATVAIASVAFVLALVAHYGSTLIDSMVAYAWTGLGASFGPPLLFALWWRRTTWQGALAGMVGGMIATIAWKNSALLADLIDIKAGAVLFSAVLVVVVTLVTRPHGHRTQVTRGHPRLRGQVLACDTVLALPGNRYRMSHAKT